MIGVAGKIPQSFRALRYARHLLRRQFQPAAQVAGGVQSIAPHRDEIDQLWGQLTQNL
jgi:hypothetical protein